jgi:hypothetical protein
LLAAQALAWWFGRVEEKPMTVFDYARPYDIMVGYWAGIANGYDPKGKYAGVSAPSRVAVYWKKKYSLLHFRTDGVSLSEKMLKDSPLRAAFAQLLGLEFDLNVSGKHATTSRAAETAVTGTQTRADVYHFHLQNTSQGTDWYNTHYFTSAEERQIMGPGLLNNKIGMIVIQTFTRLSYDVPKPYKRELRR